jgi:DNA polymerase elongation subunit (family B)
LDWQEVWRCSTGWVWEKILEDHYNNKPEPDPKKDYEGGLVWARTGLFRNCAKIDVASLYPTIMLAFRVHSRKDHEQVMLRWLKTLREERLKLKDRAKAGDKMADAMQSAMKVLINSAYGFMGAGNYGFNDMEAAEKVTAYGRKILTLMAATIEDCGGLIVECDTDGIIFQHENPDEVKKAVQNALPEPFQVELEWAHMAVFVEGKKNYTVVDPATGNIVEVKGGNLRGRDKERFKTEFKQNYIVKAIVEGLPAADHYAQQVREIIASGLEEGWEWVKRTHKVGNNDKFLTKAGFSVGEQATYAYRSHKDKNISKEPSDGYDVDYYLKEFEKELRKLKKLIAGSGAQ